MWRTASGILSLVSFHGYRLTCAFGARCTVSIATAYGCPGTSSGNTKIGVWQLRTKSRVTVYTKSARAPVYMLVRKVSTIAIVMSGRRGDKSRPPPFLLLFEEEARHPAP